MRSLGSAAMLIALTAFALAASAAPKFTIDGQPIMGSFAVTWEVDDLRHALDTRINLVYCYDRKASAQLLDPRTELGALLVQRRAKAMYNLLMPWNRYRLAKEVDSQSGEILLSSEADVAGPGTLWIGDEAVRFASCEKGLLRGCLRGYHNTRPSPHAAGEYALHEDLVREEVLKIKDSPNLWGYWVMDDKRGRDVRNVLRNLYRLIKSTDTDPTGKRNPHVVVAGMADEDALTNFDAGVCDMVGVYIYPAHGNVFRHTYIAERLAPMLPIIAKRSPDTPVMGIFQAFTGKTWAPRPTPLQVRKQARDFACFGASALMVYSWRMVAGSQTLRDMPDLREEVGRIIQDLRSGRIALDQSWPQPPARRLPAPALSQFTPVLTFKGASALPGKTREGLAVHCAPGPDGSTWLHMDFAQYVQGRQEWPGIPLTLPSAKEGPEAAASGWLVAKVHNFLPGESEVGISVRDSRGRPFWAHYFPLAAGRTTNVCVPLANVRRIVDLSDLAGVTVFMRRPAGPTHLALEGLYLAPRQFARAAGFTFACPRTATLPAIGGGAADPAWNRVEPLLLQDELLNAPPLRRSSVRVMSSGQTIFLQVVSEGIAPYGLVVGAESNAQWSLTDDTVECLVQNPKTGDFLRLIVNPNGRSAVSTTRADGRRGPPVQTRIASVVDPEKWRLEAAVDLADLGGDVEEWGFNLRRNDAQIGPLVWAKDPTLPEGVDALGTLRLMDR